MTLIQLFLDQLDREAPRTRRALERVPQGHDDWKPHAKSMPLLRLAGLVASMPSWISLIINKDELDLNPPAGQGQYQQPSAGSLVQTLEKAVRRADVVVGHDGSRAADDELEAPCQRQSRE